MKAKYQEPVAARYIRKYVTTHTMSLRTLAAYIPIDPSRLCRLMKGNGTPSLHEAVRIQDMCDIAPHLWLYTEE